MAYTYNRRRSLPSSEWFDRQDTTSVDMDQKSDSPITQTSDGKLLTVNPSSDGSNYQLYDMENDVVISTIAAPRTLNENNFGHIYTTRDGNTSYVLGYYWDSSEAPYEPRTEVWYLDWTTNTRTRVFEDGGPSSAYNYNRVDAVAIPNEDFTQLFALCVAWNTAAYDYQFQFMEMYVGDLINNPGNTQIDWGRLERVRDFNRASGDTGYFFLREKNFSIRNNHAAVGMVAYWNSTASSYNNRYLPVMYTIDFNDSNPFGTITYIPTSLNELLLPFGLGLYLKVTDSGDTLNWYSIETGNPYFTSSKLPSGYYDGDFDAYLYCHCPYKVQGDYMIVHYPTWGGELTAHLIEYDPIEDWNFSEFNYPSINIPSYYHTYVDTLNSEIPISMISDSDDARFAGKVPYRKGYREYFS